MRRKNFKIFTIVLAAVLVTGCGGNKPDVTEETKTTSSSSVVEETTSAGNVDTEVKDGVYPLGLAINTVRREVADTFDGVQYSQSYYGIELLDESLDKYPKLQLTLDNEFKAEVEYFKNSETETLEFIGTITPEEQEYIGSDFYDYNEGIILRADDNIVSVLNSHSSYMGGVHGYYSYGASNYDTKTGKKLTFTDVVLDTDKFFELVDEKLQVEYADLYDSLFIDVANDYAKDLELDTITNWSVGYQGVTIYFNPYDIASFADGMQIITIYYDEAPELFKEEYTIIPEDYVIPVYEFKEMYVDIDGDGDREEISLNKQYVGDDYIIADYTLNVDGVEFEAGYGYDCRGYIVHANDRFYFYGDVEEDMFNNTAIVDLKTMQNMTDANDDMVLGGSFKYSYESSDSDALDSTYYSSNYTFTNPDEFMGGVLVVIFDMSFWYGKYQVSEDGTPVLSEKYYNIHNYLDYEMQFKGPIEGKVVDDNGDETGAVSTITDDEILEFVRTDGHTFMDVRRIGGSDEVVRLYVDDVNAQIAAQGYDEFEFIEVNY